MKNMMSVKNLLNKSTKPIEKENKNNKGIIFQTIIDLMNDKINEFIECKKLNPDGIDYRYLMRFIKKLELRVDILNKKK